MQNSILTTDLGHQNNLSKIKLFQIYSYKYYISTYYIMFMLEAYNN